MNASPELGLLEQSPSRVKSRTVAFGLILLCAIAVAIFHNQILWGLGAMLVHDAPPQQAEIAVTLAGDPSGRRILKAAELVRAGYVPNVLVSGAGITYGIPQSTLEINLAVGRGYPREYFIPLQHSALSTKEEAQQIVSELNRRGIHKYLLVTSYFHTARARRILRRSDSQIEMHVVGASYPHWNNGFWWKEREGEKIWLEEAVKTIADFLGV